MKPRFLTVMLSAAVPYAALFLFCNADAVASAPMTVVLKATVSREKGALLKVSDPQSPVFGAQIQVPPGALLKDREKVTLSYSKELPGPPRKIESGLTIVQNSLSFALTVESGQTRRPIIVRLPYFESDEAKEAGMPTVFFFWDSSIKSYQTLAPCLPVKVGQKTLIEFRTMGFYPQWTYVSLALAVAGGFQQSKHPQPAASAGWRSVPNADKCLAMAAPRPVPQSNGKSTLYESVFSNRCDFAIQASACRNSGKKPCTLPQPTILPAHGKDTFHAPPVAPNEVMNVGACPLTLKDGTTVVYDLVKSSLPAVETVCIVRKQSHPIPGTHPSE